MGIDVFFEKENIHTISADGELITYNGYKVDLVPAKRQSQYGNDHSLYRRKANSWTKTNIDTHISNVRNSGRKNEIIALKIWRENHKLNFPSIYLEMLTIEALRGRSLNAPAENFLYLLGYIRDNISSKVVLDPANSNNRLSDELSNTEKQLLAQQAKSSLYSFRDFKYQLEKRQHQYNNFPMRPLNWRSPKQALLAFPSV